MFRYGRINRATYWPGIGILAAITLAAYFLANKPIRISEAMIVIIALPRLHDIGRSAWWAGGMFLAELIIVVAAFSLLPREEAMIAAGFFVIFAAGLLIFLGCLPGDPEANKYGEPPPAGIGYRNYRKPDPASNF